MPREITTTVYTFGELLDLHEKGKAEAWAVRSARHWFTEGLNTYDWWSPTYEFWEQALGQIGIEDIEISFRGFWSQGDGASFTGGADVDRLADFLARPIRPSDRVQLRKGREEYRPWIVGQIGGKPARPQYRRLRRFSSEIGLRFLRTDHHYAHPQTCSTSIEAAPDEADETLLRAFEDDVEQLRRDLSKAIYRSLEAEYEYLTSDEMYRDSSEANDYTFTLGGRRLG